MKPVNPKPRFLHVPVTPAFLLSVNVEAASRGLTVRDFVVQSIAFHLKKKEARHGKRK